MVILYFLRAGYMAMSVWQDYVTSPREYDGFPTRRNLILEWNALRIMVAEPQYQRRGTHVHRPWQDEVRRVRRGCAPQISQAGSLR